MGATYWQKKICGTWRRAAAGTLVACSLGVPAIGQTAPEPVDQIRATLKGFDQTPGDREKALRAQVAKLANLQEVRLALELVEWHSPESGSAHARVDAQVRAELVDRLADGYRKVLAGSDKSQRALLLTTLTECTKDRVGGRGVLDACSLVTAELGRVGSGNDPELGVMAIELLGRTPVPASAVAGLFEACLLPDSPMRRLAVAEALGDMARRELQTGRGVNGNPGRSLEQLATLTTLVGRLSADEQVRVRRASLEAVLCLAQLGHAVATDRSPLPAGEGEGARDLATGNASRLTTVLGARVLVCLRDPDAETRRKAQACLGELFRVRAALVENPRSGTDPLGAVLAGCLNTLGEALRDPDAKVRRAALENLEILGAESAPCGKAVLQALDDPDAFARWGAIRVLVSQGKSAPSGTAEAIQERLEDQDADVRAAAEGALRRLRE
jgi:HEAT repeat protein